MFVVADDLIGRTWIEFWHRGNPVLNLANPFEKLSALAVGYAVKSFRDCDFQRAPTDSPVAAASSFTA